MYWPFFGSAFWFFDGKGNIVEKYNFYSGGLQLKFSGIRASGFEIKGHWYRMFIEHGAADDYCYGRDVAMLKAHIPRYWSQSGYIKFTNAESK